MNRIFSICVEYSWKSSSKIDSYSLRSATRNSLFAILVGTGFFVIGGTAVGQQALKPSTQKASPAKTPVVVAPLGQDEETKAGSEQLAEVEKSQSAQQPLPDGRAIYKRLLQSGVWIHIDTGQTTYS